MAKLRSRGDLSSKIDRSVEFGARIVFGLGILVASVELLFSHVEILHSAPPWLHAVAYCIVVGLAAWHFFFSGSTDKDIPTPDSPGTQRLLILPVSAETVVTQVYVVQNSAEEAENASLSGGRALAMAA